MLASSDFEPKEKYFAILSSVFCMVLLLSNFLGTKIFSFFSIPLPASILIYPLSFVINAAITEIYGPARTRFTVYLGFSITLLSYLFTQCILSLPPHSFWVLSPHLHSSSSQNEALKATFYVTGFNIAASLFAYLCSQLLDIFLFSKIKEKTHGKALWLRSQTAILASQALDTVIVSLLVLYLSLKMSLLQSFYLILTTYVAKALVAIFVLPLLYSIVKFFRGNLQPQNVK